MMVTGSVPAGNFLFPAGTFDSPETFDLPETAGKMASLAVESLAYFSLECKFDSGCQDKSRFW